MFNRGYRSNFQGIMIFPSKPPFIKDYDHHPNKVEDQSSSKPSDAIRSIRPFRHQSLHGDFAISVVQHFEEPKKILRACATLVGGWATPLKNISQLGSLFPIYGKISKPPTRLPEIHMKYYEITIMIHNLQKSSRSGKIHRVSFCGSRCFMCFTTKKLSLP